jgi:hypothetical protein
VVGNVKDVKRKFLCIRCFGMLTVVIFQISSSMRSSSAVEFFSNLSPCFGTTTAALFVLLFFLILQRSRHKDP